MGGFGNRIEESWKTDPLGGFGCSESVEALILPRCEHGYVGCGVQDAG